METSEYELLLARLVELDKRERGPCGGCFLGCEPGRGSRPYQCPEPLRQWAVRHKWSAGMYEEEG